MRTSVFILAACLIVSPAFAGGPTPQPNPHFGDGPMDLNTRGFGPRDPRHQNPGSGGTFIDKNWSRDAPQVQKGFQGDSQGLRREAFPDRPPPDD